MQRFLFSCGYKVTGKTSSLNGWTRADVVDRASGEDRGVRWVRPKGEQGGFEIVSKDPHAKRLAS